MAETTHEALKAEAEARGVSMSQLARYFVERGLGLSAPGMANADERLWVADAPDY
jgi:hypothetical protein